MAKRLTHSQMCTLRHCAGDDRYAPRGAAQAGGRRGSIGSLIARGLLDKAGAPTDAGRQVLKTLIEAQER